MPLVNIDSPADIIPVPTLIPTNSDGFVGINVGTGIYPNGTEDLNGAIAEAYGCMLWDNYPTYAQTENGLVRLPKSRVVDDHKNVIHEFF